jgi:Putative Ig domain
LTVDGTNFVSTSVVRWSGSNRTTTFVTSTQLRTAIPASDIAAPGTASITVANPGGAISNAVTFTISALVLTITTSSPLPQGTVGSSYSQTLAASGGITPYSWSLTAGSLPAGLTLNPSSGAIGGTPSAVGNFTFTVRVSDSAAVSATKQFQLSIGSTATPVFTISGVSDIVEPAQQPSVEITLSSTHPSPISGQLALKFNSNADVASDDPSIQFSTGGRTVNFSIPANTTRAVFSNSAPNIAFQTGTVSGTIELTVSGQSGGGSGTPLPPASRLLTLSRRAPVITRLIIASRTASGFELAITGFSTPRSLTQANFTFTAAQGATLETGTVMLNLAVPATSWFQSQPAAALGGQFRVLMPFTVQGQVTAIQSVSVTLANGEGSSAASSVQF